MTDPNATLRIVSGALLEAQAAVAWVRSGKLWPQINTNETDPIRVCPCFSAVPIAGVLAGLTRLRPGFQTLRLTINL